MNFFVLFHLASIFIISFFYNIKCIQGYHNNHNNNNSNIEESNNELKSRRNLFTDAEVRSFHLMTQGEFCQDHISYRYKFSCKHQKRVLVIPQNFPVPTLHGSDKRCYHILEALRALDHTVAVIPYSRSFNKPGEEDKLLLKQLKVSFFPNYMIQFKRNTTLTFQNVINKFKPDVIITWLWFWEMKMNAPDTIIPLIQNLRPKLKFITFTDDVHSKREKQIAEQFKNKNALDHYMRRSVKMLNMEKHVYSSSDVVVAISSADRSEIATMDVTDPSKILHVRYIASPWDHASSSPKGKFRLPSFQSRNQLVFVGNGENPTNIHAMKWYLSSIAPEMDKGIPGVKLVVIGQSWDAFVEGEVDANKYMIFKGSLSTEDMNKVIDECKVFIAPIRASTGINTKNVLALNRGIPLVTTPAGAIGMCGKCDDAILINPHDPFAEDIASSTADIPLLIGHDNYDIVRLVKEVYYDEHKWSGLSRAGIEHVKRWFGLAEAAQELDNVLSRAYN